MRIRGWQRQRNVLRLLCLLNTDEVRNILEPILEEKSSSVKKVADFLKLYLSVEAWFLSVNKKKGVHASCSFIGHVIQMLQDLFLQGGQGWNIPNIHGLTQLQLFIILFGSADHFNTDTG